CRTGLLYSLARRQQYQDCLRGSSSPLQDDERDVRRTLGAVAAAELCLRRGRWWPVMRNDELSARHFTTSADQIVVHLWHRAADPSMSTELTEQSVPMLALWSLLRWERKVGLVALKRMGVEVDALAQDVDRALDAACTELRRVNGPPRLQTLPLGQRGIV